MKVLRCFFILCKFDYENYDYFEDDVDYGVYLFFEGNGVVLKIDEIGYLLFI